MSILVKKCKCFQVVAMADAHQEEVRCILQPTGAVGLSIDPDIIARGIWEDPRSTFFGPSPPMPRVPK